jgi:nucleobase:cation symporter-1, NCS1 family
MNVNDAPNLAGEYLASAGGETESFERGAGIEQHSIDFIAEHERHGRVSDQGRFWFLTNFQFFGIAIGFIGPSLGLSLPYTLLAGTLGVLIGTIFQAFHASQGPEMGLPQMIQSRAQFGYRGVIVPLVISLVSLIGYNVVSAILVSEGTEALWGLNRVLTVVGISVLAGALAIWGYDWLHRVFKALFWVNLPLFTVLSVAVVLGKGGGGADVHGQWSWVAFGTQLASAASYNITCAPTVSDYSRYLPSRTPRSHIIANVFAGAALSAIWLIAFGAWLATHLGTHDALFALQRSGNALLPGFGTALAAISITALVAGMGATAYSAMLVMISTADSIRPVRPSRSLRVSVILSIMVLWIVLAVSLSGNSVTYVNGMLVMMLYLLMPWTAVNLVDYFFLRRGRYAIRDLFEPRGIYGTWGIRGLAAYVIGFTVSIPFFVIPNVYTGAIAAKFGGVDFGWLVSGVTAATIYMLFSRGFDAASEEEAIAASARLLSEAAADRQRAI